MEIRQLVIPDTILRLSAFATAEQQGNSRSVLLSQEWPLSKDSHVPIHCCCKPSKAMNLILLI